MAKFNQPLWGDSERTNRANAQTPSTTHTHPPLVNGVGSESGNYFLDGFSVGRGAHREVLCEFQLLIVSAREGFPPQRHFRDIPQWKQASAQAIA